MIRSIALCGLALTIGQTLPTARLTADEMETRIERRVPPEYPNIARAAKVEATVTLRLRVDSTGSVTAAVIVSGTPLLNGSAIEAVKQWRFRSGQLDVVGDVHVPFYLNEPSPVAVAEFDRRKSECQLALRGGDFARAEAPCVALRDAAARNFADYRRRADAYGLVGYTLLGLGRPREALDVLNAEIGLRARTVNIQLVQAHQNAARAHARLTDIRSAKRSFEEAEGLLRQIELNFPKSSLGTAEAVLRETVRTEVLEKTTQLLNEFAFYLREAGELPEAAKVEARLAEALQRQAGKF